MDIDVVDVETREQILAANKAQLLKWLTKLQMAEHAFNKKMVIHEQAIIFEAHQLCNEKKKLNKEKEGHRRR